MARAARGARAALALLLATAGLAPGGAVAAALPRLGAAPNFALMTQRNERLWLTHLRGRVVALTFTCARCGACPLGPLVELSRRPDPASAPRAFFVAVTVDPEHDSTPVLRQFARDLGVDPVVWLFLTGKPGEIEAVTRWYGVAVRHEGGRPAVDCPVILIDPGGTIRARHAARERDAIRAGLAALLAEAGGS